ncbi:hypothetical protein KEM54_003249 [Ascosphaera aggregata]|nr:hypothetical protein KEM54_003249 [Ascosphaera aggregata]
MKLLTKQDEEAHYAQVLRYGTTGGLIGLGTGIAGILFANRRIPLIRDLTLPMKAFLVTSTGTIGGILAADRGSRRFEFDTNASKRVYHEREMQLRQARMSQLSATDRVLEWCREKRYSIVGATWVASMVGSWVLVSRDKYLTGKQKIVQARVYAQGLTLAVLIASAAFEIADQRKAQAKADQAKREGKPLKKEESRVGTDMWKDMVEAEEIRNEKREGEGEEEKKE